MTEPIDHLFRREAGRMVAALTRVFGVNHLALAEDVVQDALCRALEVWAIRGVPENPTAWLRTTAKNCALDALRRERTARTFAPEIGRATDAERALLPAVEDLFRPATIPDDMLRMMFSCCHPRLHEEAQVALILHILCGFSVGEIAAAFLSGEEAIKKRITRAKGVLAGSKKLFELTDADFTSRLDAVQRALYLLFNEGYHGASAESVVREDLCEEAMRLSALLCQNELTATPATRALSALMCFHAARLPARLDVSGELTSLFEQDRSQWDPRLVAEGQRLLDLSAVGEELSAYHVEAGIASLHAGAESVEDTPWTEIVSLYDTLMRIRPSPVVALHRALALAQRDGPERGLEAIRAIVELDRLAEYPFYSAALGELELRSGRSAAAQAHFTAAIALARNPAERRLLERRLEASRAMSVESN
jgi:RNA polymerase sigma-70 factor (ECF subfamily)